MGADYLFELISIETYAPPPQFIGHNKSFLSLTYLRHPTTTPESTDSDFFIYKNNYYCLVLHYKNVNK